MQVSTIRLDLAKNVFQVHGIDANENGSVNVKVTAVIYSCPGFSRVKVSMPRALWS